MLISLLFFLHLNSNEIPFIYVILIAFNFNYKILFQVLSNLLYAAKNAGLVVQENIVCADADRTSVARTLQGLLEAARS